MENTPPGPSKSQGYQKQVKKDEVKAPPKPKGTVDYSSPAAKKLPRLFEAIEKGNIEVVKQLVEEGMNLNVSREGHTPLMLAASKGQVEIVELILNTGVNINEKSIDDGSTALHKAAVDQDRAAVVELLIQSGIYVEAKNTSGKTALALAEEMKRREVILCIKKHQQKQIAEAAEWQEFLDSPEGKPYKLRQQYDALSLVFRYWWLPVPVLAVIGLACGLPFGVVVIAGVIGTVLGLLVGLSIFFREKKVGAYLDAIGPLPLLDIHTLRQKRKSGEPILPVRGSGGKSAGATVDAHDAALATGDSALADAVPVLGPIEEDGHVEPPASKSKRDLKLINYSLLALAILVCIGVALFTSKDSLAKWYYMKKLENKGIPFTEQAFLAEVARNNDEAVDLFLRSGINSAARNEKGQTALMIASEQGHARFLNRLIARDPFLLPQVDKSGNTALMTAARLGRVNVVAMLHENGADINEMVSSNDGAASALQTAVDAADFTEEHAKVVRYLLDQGVDVKGRSKSGRSALQFAADHGRAEVAGILIEKGADVNETDQQGDFPLLSAACKGHTGFVALLAEKNADMKMASPEGLTPLMCAAREGHGDTVKALLEKGVPVNAQDKSGVTALDGAARMGQVDVVKVLLAHGADPGIGSVPESFSSLNGRTIALKAKKGAISDLLKRIAQTASQDGYEISVDSKIEKRMNITIKAPWNRVLQELARKNQLVLVVKEKTVHVLAHDLK